MKKRGSERGISPLIATVLIIGFVVMIAAVLFIWGGKFTRETIARQEYKIGTALQCGQVDFDVSFDLDCKYSSNGGVNTYKKDSTIFENKGQVPIIDFYVRVHTTGSFGVFTETAGNRLGNTGILPMNPYEIKTVPQLVELIHGAEKIPQIESIPKIDLIPVIKLETGEEVSCADRFMEIEIPDCVVVQ